MEFESSLNDAYKQIRDDLSETLSEYCLVSGAFEITLENHLYSMKDIEIWQTSNPHQLNEIKDAIENYDFGEFEIAGLYQFEFLLKLEKEKEDPYIYEYFDIVSEWVKLIATKKQIERQEKLNDIFSDFKFNEYLQ